MKNKTIYNIDNEITEIIRSFESYNESAGYHTIYIGLKIKKEIAQKYYYFSLCDIWEVYSADIIKWINGNHKIDMKDIPLSKDDREYYYFFYHVNQLEL